MSGILASYQSALEKRRLAREQDRLQHRERKLKLRNLRVQTQDVKPASKADYTFMRRDEFFNPDN